MKIERIYSYGKNDPYDAIQYTGNYDEVIGFVGGANNVNLIDENFHINTKGRFIEVAKYGDYILKDKYNVCHVCQKDAMFKLYKKA